MMIYNKRTKEDGAHEVRGTSALRRPERSGDLEPARDSPLEPKGFLRKNIPFHSILFKLV